MKITEHALIRARERFDLHGIEYIKNLIRESKETFDIIDVHRSYDLTQDKERKQIVVDSKRRAYFVIHNHTVQTVLKEAMAMRAFKLGKWTKL